MDFLSTRQIDEVSIQCPECSERGMTRAVTKGKSGSFLLPPEIHMDSQGHEVHLLEGPQLFRGMDEEMPSGVLRLRSGTARPDNARVVNTSRHALCNEHSTPCNRDL